VGPIRGPEGPDGPDGPKGDDGTSVVIKGSVQTVGDLDNIQDPEIGDLYVVIASGDGYIYDGENWNNIGPIRGPEGPQGDPGEKGDKGDQGDQGDEGSSFIFRGSVEDLQDLYRITDAELGDLYLNQDDGDGYVYSDESAWGQFADSDILSAGADIYYSYNDPEDFLNAFASPDDFTLDKIIHHIEVDGEESFGLF
jgi:hypothetical protein